MKALDILKEYNRYIDRVPQCNDTFIDESIAELEELQDQLKQGQENYDKLWEMYSELNKQKICDGCKK